MKQTEAYKAEQRINEANAKRGQEQREARALVIFNWAKKNLRLVRSGKVSRVIDSVVIEGIASLRRSMGSLARVDVDRAFERAVSGKFPQHHAR